MSILTIALILLLIGALGSGVYGGPAYANYGYGGAGVVLVILVVLLATGRI